MRLIWEGRVQFRQHGHGVERQTRLYQRGEDYEVQHEYRGRWIRSDPHGPTALHTLWAAARHLGRATR